LAANFNHLNYGALGNILEGSSFQFCLILYVHIALLKVIRQLSDGIDAGLLLFFGDTFLMLGMVLQLWVRWWHLGLFFNRGPHL
jgi:hypothetical protein